mmetsp:Transcript_21409/g.52911  ORF Transcript_21409/g.52911 Transcript_21409/m.52911 type:complete len:85 (-) Transcript_21409:683-937(-)
MNKYKLHFFCANSALPTAGRRMTACFTPTNSPLALPWLHVALASTSDVYSAAGAASSGVVFGALEFGMWILKPKIRGTYVTVHF